MGIIIRRGEKMGPECCIPCETGPYVTAYDYALNGLKKTEALDERYGVKVGTEQ
jgi:hypothetical protein